MQTHIHGTPICVVPIYVAPVVVHRPAYVVPDVAYCRGTPLHYYRAWRGVFSDTNQPYPGDIEIEVGWKRNGYKIEIDYDD